MHLQNLISYLNWRIKFTKLILTFLSYLAASLLYFDVMTCYRCIHLMHRSTAVWIILLDMRLYGLGAENIIEMVAIFFFNFRISWDLFLWLLSILMNITMPWINLPRRFLLNFHILFTGLPRTTPLRCGHDLSELLSLWPWMFILILLLCLQNLKQVPLDWVPQQVGY